MSSSSSRARSVLQLVLKRLQLLLNDLLDLADVLVADLVVGIQDLLARQLEDHCLLGGLSHLLLEGLFEFLALLDDGIHLLGDVFVVPLLEACALLVDLGRCWWSRRVLISAILALTPAACSRSETEISSSRRWRAFLRASSST